MLGRDGPEADKLTNELQELRAIYNNLRDDIGEGFKKLSCNEIPNPDLHTILDISKKANECYNLLIRMNHILIQISKL
jgi:hypothetical protein